MTSLAIPLPEVSTVERRRARSVAAVARRAKRTLPKRTQPTGTDIAAHSVAIGHASSLDNTKRRARNGRGSQKWGELTIYRLPGFGLYFARNIVRSSELGKPDVVRDYPPSNPRALVRAMTVQRTLKADNPEQKREYVPRFVAAAIEAAAAADPVFRTGIGNTPTVEQYGDPTPQARSSAFMLSRTGERMIHFCGRVIASVRPHNTNALTTLYLLDDGTYAVAIKLVSPKIPWQTSALEVYVGLETDGVLAALRHKGGFSSGSRRLLHLGITIHPPFGDHLSHADVDTLPSPRKPVAAPSTTQGGPA